MIYPTLYHKAISEFPLSVQAQVAGSIYYVSLLLGAIVLIGMKYEL